MDNKRWLVVVGGLMIQLCLGALYAWSVFVTPLKELGLTTTQTQLIFSASIAAFAIVMIFAGRLQDNIGPRKVAAIGGILFGLGYILASRNLSFSWLIISIGIVGGAGLGLTYVCPLVCSVKWFPDKRGLVTGLSVAGFGGGALITSQIAPRLIASKGVSQTFATIGVAFIVIIFIGAMLLQNPPKNYKPKGWKEKKRALHAKKEEHDWHEMIATKQFWLLWIIFILSASAGLMVIGNLKPYGTFSGITAAIAGTAVGTLAIFNACGRIAWGWMSDRLGRPKSILIMSAMQGVAVLLLVKVGHLEMLLPIVAAFIGFNYGANYALFPSATADFFGTKNLGVNYGLLFTAFGVAGIIGPLVGGKIFDVTGSYIFAFILGSAMCFAAAALSFMIKNPYRE